MKRLSFVILVVALAMLASAASAEERTFIAVYNGDTGNDGLDADWALETRIPVDIYGDPFVGLPGMYGTTALNSEYGQTGNGDGDSVVYAGGANMPSEGTFEAWVTLPEIQGRGNHIFWTSRDGDWSIAMNIQVHGAYNGFVFRQTGGGEIPYSPAEWVIGSWHHVAMTWEDGLIQAFYDGQLVGMNTNGIALPTMDHLMIGSGTPGYAWCQTWQGMIDEVQVWDYVRRPTQIMADMGEIYIPEPSSLLVLLTGAVGFAGLIRRRRS